MKKPVIPKQARAVAFGAPAVLILVLFLFVFSNRGGGPESESAFESGAEEQASYTCPMHPQVVSDRPGSCPVCGMHLIKQKKEESPPPSAMKHEGHAEGGGQDVSETGLQAPPPADSLKKAGSDENEDIRPDDSHQKQKTEEAPGEKTNEGQAPKAEEPAEKDSQSRVKPDGAHRNKSAAETDAHHKNQEAGGAPPAGRAAVRLSFRKRQMTGVRSAKAKRRPLFKSIRAPGLAAFDPELYTAQSEYLSALNQWEKVKNSPVSDVKESVRQMIRSSKIRLKLIGLSDSQIQDLRKRGAQSESLLVSGESGAAWIYADVFEADLPHIRPGLPAEIRADFLPDQTLSGELVSADRVINPENRTARVRIRLSQPNPSLRPSSYVSVTIKAPAGERVAVPLEAVMNTGRESFLFVKKEGGVFEPRKVRVLFETDEEAAIEEGVLRAGEEVVAEGNFMLDSESRLQALLTAANP